jgi:ADP-ribose pyrophosphatase YjhB (NUDIX family)
MLLRRDDKLFFIRRANTGYKDGTFTVPAGHAEAGESYSAAAIRETREEADVVVKPEDARLVFVMQRNEGPDNIRVDLFFEAGTWTGEPRNAESHRSSEGAWFAADNLPYDQIIDFQADMFRAMAQGKRYLERGWDNAATPKPE